MITARTPEVQDLCDVALRIAPWEELEMSCFGEPAPVMEKLRECCDQSEGCLAVRGPVDDEGTERCLLLFGYMAMRNSSYSRGVVWMIPTVDAKRHRVKLHRWSKMFLDTLAGHFPCGVYNVVHADNKGTIEWLKRLGCTFTYAKREFGGEPFLTFSKGDPNCVVQP